MVVESTPKVHVTDSDEILQKLSTIEPGDELTIETESGRRDNRVVSQVTEEYITFGDPETEQATRLINIERGTVHKYPKTASEGVSASGMKLTSVSVW